MDWQNLRSVNTKIRRLEQEIADIDEFFYRGDEEDPVLYAGMLERKRDDIVRATVMQLHTAIENLLDSQILCCVLDANLATYKRKIRTKRGQALRKMLFGNGSLGFEMKLHFATALGLLDEKTKTKLTELNSLRNKCSHNWLLKSPVRYGKRPGQKKPPLLRYQGRDLHSVPVLKDFFAEFGIIYAKLFHKYYQTNRVLDVT